MRLQPQSSLPSKIICVGRNYADHAKELGNDVPSSPLLFFKPSTSLNTSKYIDINAITQHGKLGELHFECELCVQIGETLSQATAATAMQSVSGVTLGLDLTLRDVQNKLKEKGHPWERAKAFDNACVLGDWLNVASIADYTQAKYQLIINNDTRQVGDTRLMLFPIAELLADISQQFTLQAGDVVMTGTPKGVGALHAGDSISMQLHTTDGVQSWSVLVK